MRILMLEDNPSLSKLVSAYLSLHFHVDAVFNLDEALEYIKQFHYDVVLLDRDINGVDVGMSLIQLIKSKNNQTGVIVISAYDTIADKIEGLNLGADDYLDKPFDNDELLARIYALSRRHVNLNIVTFDDLECDLSAKSMRYKGDDVLLSKKESELFFYLLQKQGQIVSKDELLDALYLNPQNISSNTIDATIKNVRKKLPISLIKTIKTRGYTIEKS